MFFRKIFKSLSFIIIFIAFSSLMLLSITAYSQSETGYAEAEKYYKNGLNSLKSAKNILGTIKPNLFALIDNDPRKWSDSFNIISMLADNQVKDRINKIISDLDNALKEFDKAKQLKQDYSDVYIRLAETYLAMGNKSEAINAYKAGLQIGYNNINIPFTELKPIFHDIAIAYLANSEYSREKDPGKEVIEKLISLENDRLEMKYKQLNNKYDIARRDNAKNVIAETFAKMLKNEIERMINEIELVIYYINTGRCLEAEKEYRIKKQEYSKKSGIYSDEDKQKMRNLYAKLDEEIEIMGSFFNFIVDKNMLVAGKKASINIITQGNDIDKNGFFELTLMKDKMALNLSTYIVVDETINHKVQIIPSNSDQVGKYIARIKIPELMIKEDDILPFKVNLKRGIYEQDPMITTSLKSNTILSLKGNTGEIIIDFGKDVFTNATKMEVKKEYGVKAGLYQANMEMSFDILKSQEASIELSVVPTIPPVVTSSSDDFGNNIYALFTMLVLSLVIH